MNEIAPQKPSLLDRFDVMLQSSRKWLYVLFAAAFLVKLAYVIQSSGGLHVTVPIMDSKYYDKEAQDIAHGHLVRKDAFFMGPLYPYVLAAIYSIFGRDFMIVRIVQVLGGSLSVVLTYLIGKRVFRPSVAFAGVVMLVLYGSTTFHEGEMLMEWLGTLINLTALYVLLRSPAKRGYFTYALAGFLIGLSALARANILVLVPVVLVWTLFVMREERRVQKALLAVAAAAIAVAPATLHNYFAAKDPVLVTSNSGVNFYIGNSDGAPGYFYPAKGITLESEDATRNHVERIFGREMRPSEVSRYWFGQAMEFIKAHPLAELRLLLKKTALFFNGYEMPQIESFEIAHARYSVLRLLFVNLWMIMSLALFGMVVMLRSWKKPFLLYGYVVSYALSIIVIFVSARYRMHIAPVLCLFAGYSLVVVLPGIIRHVGKNVVRLAAFLLIIVFTRPGLFALPADDVQWTETVHQARRLSELGNRAAAIEEMNLAVKIHPEAAESYVQRAVVYKEAGNYFKAIDDYSKALKIDPALPDTRYDLAQTLRKVRMYSHAIGEYEKAIELDPVKTEAYNNLGITYMEMRNLDKAIVYFKKVIEMDPKYVKAYNNLGAAYAEKGQVAEAVTILTQATQINPRYANSYKNLAMVYVQMKKPREAYDYLSRYHDLAPDDKAATETLAKLRIATQADSARTP